MPQVRTAVSLIILGFATQVAAGSDSRCDGISLPEAKAACIADAQARDAQRAALFRQIERSLDEAQNAGGTNSRSAVARAAWAECEAMSRRVDSEARRPTGERWSTSDLGRCTELAEQRLRSLASKGIPAADAALLAHTIAALKVISTRPISPAERTQFAYEIEWRATLAELLHE